MTVRMRHTRAHTGNRRSHHALAGMNLGVCTACNTPKVKHQACKNCGKYKGRVVIDVYAKLAKKEQKLKERAKAEGKEPSKKEAK